MSIPSFEGRSKPSTWIYKVALNSAFVWKRKTGRHSTEIGSSTVETAIDAMGITPSRAAENREDLDWLYEELRKLNKVDRSIVLLYLEDLSYREMGEILGLSESNVGVRLSRLKSRLADEYARRAK